MNVGSIVLSVDAPDATYLECNGQAVSRTTYADLFALWGTRFGAGDGGTTFNLPSFYGRFPTGSHPSNLPAGSVGGTGQVTIQPGNLPSIVSAVPGRVTDSGVGDWSNALVARGAPEVHFQAQAANSPVAPLLITPPFLSIGFWVKAQA